MNSNCIVSQVHVPEFDVQGGLTAAQKLQIVEFGVQHLRSFNQNAYIILCGHGLRPSPQCLSNCDFVYWNDKSEELNEHGYVRGMPAQYKYVHVGLDHALEKGFKRCLKTRGDCIIGHKDICNYCDNILDTERKQLLITQQTGPERMGDCFMYGCTYSLFKTWHESNLVHNPDGLQNTAYHYRRANDFWQGDWLTLVKRTCSFRDVDTLKFMCLRWNYFDLDGLDKTTRERIILPSYDFAKYHWGRKNGWHYFDANRNMTGTTDYYCEKGYYA